MTTNFPAGIDTFPRPVATDPLSNPAHAALHTNVSDAVTAMQQNVGVTGETNPATVRGALLGKANVGHTHNYAPLVHGHAITDVTNLRSELDALQDDINNATVSPLTTKGDLFGFGTAEARIPVGLPGQILAADPAAIGGVRWRDEIISPVGGITLNYRFDNAVAAAGLPSGQYRLNNAAPASATQMFVNSLTQPGNDASVIWNNLDSGDFMTFWKTSGGPAASQGFKLTSKPVAAGVAPNKIYTFGIAQVVAPQGTIANNNDVAINTISTPAATLPAGGNQGHVLTKQSGTDYDVAWESGRWVLRGGDTMTGQLIVVANNPAINNGSWGEMQLRAESNNGTSLPGIGFHRFGVGVAAAFYYAGSASGGEFRTRSSGGTDSLFWHSNNDGAGSGLDADLLDGLNGNSYVLKAGDTMTGPLNGTAFNASGNVTAVSFVGQEVSGISGVGIADANSLQGALRGGWSGPSGVNAPYAFASMMNLPGFGGRAMQLGWFTGPDASRPESPSFRTYNDSGSWNPWRTFWHSANLNPVTLNTAQTITGRKTFTDRILLRNVPLDAGLNGIVDFGLGVRALAYSEASDLYIFFGPAPLVVEQGGVVCGFDNIANVGSASNRWSQVFAAVGTINTSDAREKSPLTALNWNELNAAKQLGKAIGTYKWLDAIAKKGDGARIHIGVTAQDVISIMAANGLDAMRYGFVCYDEWEAKELPTKDAEGETDVRVIAAGDRYGVRYEQLLAFIAAGFEARLAALEGA